MKTATAKHQNEEEKEPVTTFYFRGIPVSVKRRFKSLCARRGWNMNARLIQMLTEAVEKKNGKE